ncbi:MAG: Co2+/Mg2+ efflux protein ApaG [Halopseudomonas yangmingensis]
MNTQADRIRIDVQTRYLAEQSDKLHHAFSYHITISNLGDRPVQLLDRHWIITDGNGTIQEVRGPGVVGEQPMIAPGASHSYSSGCQLETPVGSMRGSYGMRCDSGELFRVEIPLFRLSKPNALN